MRQGLVLAENTQCLSFQVNGEGVRSRRWIAIAGVVAGLALILYAVFGRRSDDELIRAQLQRLADVVTFSEPGNPVARGLSLKGAFRDLFDDRVRGDIPELGSPRSGREALVQLAVQSTHFARSLSVAFSDIDVEVDATRVNAKVTATAQLHAVTREGQERWDERAVRFQFVKAERGWKIARFVVIPPDEQEGAE